MTINKSSSLLSDSINYLEANLGLHFSKSQQKDLMKKMDTLANDFKFSNTIDFLRWMNESKLTQKQTETIANRLTIGETYFYREIEAYIFLEKKILPEIIRSRKGKKRQLRIWSAGCSTGEEAYSLAISLKKVIPNIQDWNILILATDINPTFLEKARKGIYTKWSFRKTSNSFVSTYFDEVENGKFKIDESIRKMVTFNYQNIAENSYPSLATNTNAMDVIFCRNMLIYFSKKSIKKVTSKIYNSLVQGGHLIVSPVESSNFISSKFEREHFDGHTFYKKDRRKKQPRLIVPAFKFSKEKSTNAALGKKPEKKTNTVPGFRSDMIIPDVTIKKRLIPKPEKNKSTHFQIDIQSKENTAKSKFSYEAALKLYSKGSYEDLEVLLTDLMNKNNKILTQYL